MAHLTHALEFNWNPIAEDIPILRGVPRDRQRSVYLAAADGEKMLGITVTALGEVDGAGIIRYGARLSTENPRLASTVIIDCLVGGKPRTSVVCPSAYLRACTGALSKAAFRAGAKIVGCGDVGEGRSYLEAEIGVTPFLVKEIQSVLRRPRDF